MTSPVSAAKSRHQALGFTEIAERGHGFLRSRKPGSEQYALDVTLGGRGWHFGAGPYTADHEVDTAWTVSAGAWDYESVKNDFHAYVRDSVPVSYRYENAASAQYAELTVSAVEWVNDEEQSEAAATFSQVTPSVADDVITWADVATGWSISIQAQPNSLAKRILIDSLSDLGSPTIGGTNLRLRLSFTYQKSSDLELWADGSQWNEQNNTWKETTSPLEFRDETTQQPAFYFQRPIVTDLNGDEAGTIVQRVRRLGVNFYAEIDVPWTWLQSADYPITIDPTIEPTTAASGDDGGEKDNGTTEIGGTQDRLGGNYYYAFMRFQCTGPASGNTVDAAYLSLDISNGSRSSPDALIDAEDVDSSAAITNGGAGSNQISGKSLTGNSVDWTAAGLGTGYANSPSLVTPAQAVLDRGGWASGNYMGWVLDDSDTDGDMQYYTYDNGSNEPIFHLEYTAGAATGQPIMLRATTVPGMRQWHPRI